MQLHDVHTMLRLPLMKESGMEGGCNFASVSVLCAVLAGASTVFFRQHGPDGKRVTDLLAGHYPWDSQPRCVVEPSIATPRFRIGIEILWCTPWPCPRGSPGEDRRGGLSSTLMAQRSTDERARRDHCLDGKQRARIRRSRLWSRVLHGTVRETPAASICATA
jgi:hypothetical protein